MNLVNTSYQLYQNVKRHNGTSSLLSRKLTRKRWAAFFLTFTPICLQSSLMSPGTPGWSVANTCPYSQDKGVPRLWLSNFKLLNSLQVASSSCKNKFGHRWLPPPQQAQREGKERQKREGNQHLFTKHLLSAKVQGMIKHHSECLNKENSLQ